MDTGDIHLFWGIPDNSNQYLHLYCTPHYHPAQLCCGTVVFPATFLLTGFRFFRPDECGLKNGCPGSFFLENFRPAFPVGKISVKFFKAGNFSFYSSGLSRQFFPAAGCL